jgi:hypothetical protein
MWGRNKDRRDYRDFDRGGRRRPDFSPPQKRMRRDWYVKQFIVCFLKVDKHI